MKAFRLLFVLLICGGITVGAQSQFLENLTKHAQKKAKEKLASKVDEQADADYKRVKNTTQNNKPKSTNNQNNSNQNHNNSQSSANTHAQNHSSIETGGLVWNRYDFVPGDEVIFEDGPSPMEENGEFPSRWDLIDGHVEIAEADGEPCIVFLDGGKIVPYIKDASKDYLPDVFTLEFDFYYPANGNTTYFCLKDTKNQGGGQEFGLMPHKVSVPGLSWSSHPDKGNCSGGCWTHISLAYTKGKLKVYIDDARVVNMPHYKYNPLGFTFNPTWADGQHKFYLKNVRIAKGGVKYYDRVMQDGKIVCNGIRFEKGKSTLKPESMGPINKIYKLMTKNPEFKFVVEGHTDTDGDDNTNMSLSESRAKAVMDRLIQMGISKDRLQSKGWGESKPIAGNDTPEGKANNRRVEFVKF